jgi:hypothetical protein
MNAVLALGQRHSRSLLLTTDVPRAETQRYSLALMSYNNRLAKAVTAEDSDALLATATLINAYAFAAVNTNDPWRSWPLSDVSSPLQWLSVQQGPGLVIAAIAPFIEASELLAAIGDFSPQAVDDTPNTASAVQDLSTLLSILHGIPALGTAQAAESSIYRRYVDHLAALLPLQATTSNMGQFLPFIASLRAEFLDLLRGKDTAALLILAWWYALVCPLEQWWLSARVRTECAAICVFLAERCGSSIDRYIGFPVSRCGCQPLMASYEMSSS